MRFIKTETGQQAFKERSPLFSVRQRSTFILFDGHKTVEQVLTATSGMGVTQADVDAMLSNGFLALAPGESTGTMPMPLSGGAAPAKPLRSEQDRYQDAKALATQLTASLGLRGFMLNLSVESAAGLSDLIKLFPKIRDAVGVKAAEELERALKG
ncbi:MAG: hypothetical protein KGN32_08935 [Burkholderiales bacterium]|nr:hypothetical protein [Burkholderiales bacterium]